MQEEHKIIWDKCLTFIADIVTAQAYNTWFMPIVPKSLVDKKLTIQVPSHFFYEWLEEHYINLLSTVIEKELGSEGSLEYSIVMDNSHNKTKVPYTLKQSGRSSQNNSKGQYINKRIDRERNELMNPFAIPGIKPTNINPNLIPTNTFDNFIEGDCNRLARSCGKAVGTQEPGSTSFNPLFIYSANGLGKTHLAQAIGLECKKNFQDKIVLYVHSYQFLQQFLDAVKTGNYNDFIFFYQSVDMLIIDDIHNLAGKEKTLDVFFQIFQHLHHNRKQIIITSDIPPSELNGFSNRLLSRFKWGMAADLQAPDLETRMAIIEKKTYNIGITLEPEIIEHLAYSITDNVRELEGAIVSIQAYESYNKQSVDINIAKQIIDKYVKNNKQDISIEQIKKMVSDTMQVSIEKMNSKTRKREVTQARQLAMYFSKQHTQASLVNIGKQCGNRDHATVLHAIKTINNLKETDKTFLKYFKEIEKKIKKF